MARKGRVKSFTLGALLGGISAGLAALLFAPKSGKKMREDIKNGCCGLTEKSQELYEDIKDRTKGFAKDTKKAANKRFMKK